MSGVRPVHLHFGFCPQATEFVQVASYDLLRPMNFSVVRAAQMHHLGFHNMYALLASCVSMGHSLTGEG